jgi:L-cysteine desulfidase
MNLLKILEQEIKPALGCTEPIAIALATSKSYSITKGTIEKLEVFTDKNVFKNAYSVGIPGTNGLKGVQLAAALGFVCGNPDYGLECLKNVDENCINKAKALVEAGKIIVALDENLPKITVVSKLKTDKEFSEVRISGYHDRFEKIVLNNKVILNKPPLNSENVGHYGFETFENLYGELISIEIAPYKEIIDEAIDLNMNLYEDGIKGRGLEIGRRIKDNIGKIYNDDLINKIKYTVAAAVDSRMSGSKLPAMSCGGSGDQGIFITLSIYKYGIENSIEKDKLYRALLIGYLTSIYIKSKLARIGPICLSSIVGAAGVAAAYVYMMNGNYDQTINAIKGVLSDSFGLICDGAKETCSLKIIKGVGSAIDNSRLAMLDMKIESQGIIGRDFEKTIDALGYIINSGMSNLDDSIVKVIENDSRN